MRAMKAKEIKVWDPLLRLFHWTLLGSFCAAWFSQGELFESLQDRLSGELLQEVHVWAGYAIAALLLFRLFWGFVGPRYARFSDFVRRPGETLAYLKAVLSWRAPRHLGHNPAGLSLIHI